MSNTPTKFTRKPQTVTAVQWDGDSITVDNIFQDNLVEWHISSKEILHAADTWWEVGDWIVCLDINNFRVYSTERFFEFFEPLP